MCTERTSNYIIIGYIVHLCFASSVVSGNCLFNNIALRPFTLLIYRNFACSTLIAIKDGQTYTQTKSYALVCRGFNY